MTAPQRDGTLSVETIEMTGESGEKHLSAESLQTKPESEPGEKQVDGTELLRLQQQWKNVIREQAELLRVKDDIRRQIRDEHKQIKMIQIVRNHRSRLNAVRPAHQDPLEKMSTGKLRDVLQRVIESIVKLTQNARALADEVFDGRMSLVQHRISSTTLLLSRSSAGLP